MKWMNGHLPAQFTSLLGAARDLYACHSSEAALDRLLVESASCQYDEAHVKDALLSQYDDDHLPNLLPPEEPHISHHRRGEAVE